jgi:hypothetical protein
MRIPSFFAIAVAAMLMAGGQTAQAQDKKEYVPAATNEVVIYTHRFKPENFEEGLKLVQEGFTAAQAKMGQTRLNYFLADRNSHDVVVVSFFGEGMSVEDWHEFVGRLEVLQKLEPMRRSPLEVERFAVDAITTAP